MKAFAVCKGRKIQATSNFVRPDVLRIYRTKTEAAKMLFYAGEEVRQVEVTIIPKKRRRSGWCRVTD